MVVGEVQPHAQSTAGTSSSSRAGSCSPRRRAPSPASTRRPARSAARRCCRRPAPCVRPPSSIRPISVVVVDFPFVPVMAITRPAQPARRQLQLADDLDAARRAPRRTPAARAARRGSSTIRSAAGERRRAVAAELELDAGVAQARRRRRRSARVSVSITRAPRRASSSAAAMPLRAAPTTTTRRPSTENASLPRHHRSFNVVRLNSAKMTARIRKRVMTFGSLQPMQLEVVVERRHLEDALAGQLERGDLDDHRQRLRARRRRRRSAAAAPA